jgi:hypothetical protein
MNYFLLQEYTFFDSERARPLRTGKEQQKGSVIHFEYRSFKVNCVVVLTRIHEIGHSYT